MNIPCGETKEISFDEADNIVKASWPLTQPIDYSVHTTERNDGVDAEFSAAFWRLYLYALILVLIGAAGTVLL